MQSFKILDWKSSSGFSCFHLRGISELLWEVNYYQYEDRPAAESTLDSRRRRSMPTKFDNVLNETIKILRSRSVFFSKSLNDNLWIFNFYSTWAGWCFIYLCSRLFGWVMFSYLRHVRWMLWKVMEQKLSIS